MKEKIKSHQDLDLWKISMDFSIHLYKLTETFPQSEKFGLVSQIRRSGVSVCSNIAEGAARQHPKEFIQFLYIAQGSLSEIETQLEIAYRLQFIKMYDREQLMIIRIRKMLVHLMEVIKSKL